MDNKHKILVVDDDVNIIELLTLYLRKESYDTVEAYDGKAAIEAFMKYAPNLVLLDIMLPFMDGYDVLKNIRKASSVPVIMLTAKGETFDKVLALELGADDYIVKPFDTKELVARVKAVLRRYNNNVQDNAEVIVFPNLTINLTDYSVTYYGENIDLPPKEFELLHFLSSHKNQVFSREQLLDRIWGYDFFGDSRTVDVHIKRIREKINKDDNFGIKTVWGVGYKWEC